MRGNSEEGVEGKGKCNNDGLRRERFEVDS